MPVVSAVFVAAAVFPVMGMGRMVAALICQLGDPAVVIGKVFVVLACVALSTARTLVPSGVRRFFIVACAIISVIVNGEVNIFPVAILLPLVLKVLDKVVDRSQGVVG